MVQSIFHFYCLKRWLPKLQVGRLFLGMAHFHLDISPAMLTDSKCEGKR